MSKYAAFFSAYNASVTAGNTLSREEQIRTFTNQRTASLKDLAPDELQQLTALLNQAAGFKAKPPAEGAKEDKMRKSIIAIFKKMGQGVPEAKAWAEKQGVKGIKRAFNDYTSQELFQLIRVAEKVLADYQLAIRKSLAQK